MKKILIILLLFFLSTQIQAQVTSLAPGEYKSIIIPNYSPIGDYTRALILLHEVFSDSSLHMNYAIGTITALRGSPWAWHRVNLAEINSGSSFNNITASVRSTYNNATSWKLKTCVFNGKKYLALDIPYADSYHDNGYRFTGWTISTGENMLAVPYLISGQPANQNVLSNIEDFNANLTETHDVQQLNVLTSVNIGTETTNPDYKLQVKGKVRAQEIKVEATNWPDYVFAKDYSIPTLAETEKHIKEKGHLPGIPSAKEVETNGIDLGDMNAKLLQKIEELTLHLIEKDKQLNQLVSDYASQKVVFASEKKLINKLLERIDVLEANNLKR